MNLITRYLFYQTQFFNNVSKAKLNLHTRIFKHNAQPIKRVFGAVLCGSAFGIVAVTQKKKIHEILLPQVAKACNACEAEPLNDEEKQKNADLLAFELSEIIRNSHCFAQLEKELSFSGTKFHAQRFYRLTYWLDEPTILEEAISNPELARNRPKFATYLLIGHASKSARAIKLNRNPLHIAVCHDPVTRNGDLGFMKIYLDAHPEWLSQNDIYGHTPVRLAIKNAADQKTIRFLLDQQVKHFGLTSEQKHEILEDIAWLRSCAYIYEANEMEEYILKIKT